MAELSSTEYYEAVRNGLFAARGDATAVEVVRCMSLNDDMVTVCHEDMVPVAVCVEKMQGALRTLRNHNAAARTVVALNPDNLDEVRDLKELKELSRDKAALVEACDGDDEVHVSDTMHQDDDHGVVLNKPVKVGGFDLLTMSNDGMACIVAVIADNLEKYGFKLVESKFSARQKYGLVDDIKLDLSDFSSGGKLHVTVSIVATPGPIG